MIPLLLISNDEKLVEKYVQELQKNLSIPHAYVFTIRKDGAQLKVDQIREMHTLIRPLSSSATIVKLFDFETAKPDVQNMLLKTLEESPPLSQFILAVQDESAVLPTIVSRSKVVRLQKKVAKERNFELKKDIGSLFIDFDGMQKNPSKAISLCDELLGFFQKNLRNAYINKRSTASILSIIDEILTTRTLLLKNNINPQLAIDHLMVFIHSHEG